MNIQVWILLFSAGALKAALRFRENPLSKMKGGKPFRRRQSPSSTWLAWVVGVFNSAQLLQMGELSCYRLRHSVHLTTPPQTNTSPHLAWHPLETSFVNLEMMNREPALQYIRLPVCLRSNVTEKRAYNLDDLFSFLSSSYSVLPHNLFTLS